MSNGPEPCALLTSSGTIIGQKQFNFYKDKFIVKKYIDFTKKTFSYDLFKKIQGNNKLYYQIPRGIFKLRVDRPQLPYAFDETPVSLLDYQKCVVKTVSKEIQERGSFFLQMDTGLGKSYIAAGLINEIGLRTCIIVSNKALKQQMEDDIKNALKGVPVTLDKHGKEPIVILIVNTAVKLPIEFWSEIGLVILDEVHSYCCPSLMEIFFRADWARYVFGMTATPKRLDGMEKISVMHLGPWTRAESMYGKLVKPAYFYGDVIRVNYHGPPEKTQRITSTKGTTCTILMAKQFMEDLYRIKMAAKAISELFKAGRCTYVFCQTKSPLKEIRELILELLPEITKKDIFIVTGDSKKDEIKAARTSARIFLTTYMMTSKGLSIIRFDSLVFLTPMKNNMEQIVGRIFRKCSDEKIRRIIIDIVDEKTSLKSQWYERKKEYNRRGLLIKVAKYEYDKEDFSRVSAACKADLLYEPARYPKVLLSESVDADAESEDKEDIIPEDDSGSDVEDEECFDDEYDENDSNDSDDLEELNEFDKEYSRNNDQTKK